MMERALIFCALLALTPGDASGTVACPEGFGQKIISKNPAFLDTGNIIASSSRSSLSEDKLINFDFDPTVSVWCTQEDVDPNPTINITFSQHVVITGLLSGGYTYGSGNTEYVTNFTLEYSSDYGSGGPMEFAVPSLNLFVPVCPSIVVKSLHLSIIQYKIHIGDICWSLAFFGCPLPEGFNITETSYTASSTYTPSPTTAASEMPMSSSPLLMPSSPAVSPTVAASEGSCQSVRVEKDYMVVAIVLPVALITLILVLFSVAIGVVICSRNALGKWSPFTPGPTTRPRTGTDVTMKTVYNTELYQMRELQETGGNGQDTIRQHDTSRGETVYETVGGEPDSDNEGLITNALYGASNQYTEKEVKVIYNDCYGEVLPSESEENTGEYAYPSMTVPSAPAAVNIYVGGDKNTD